MSTLIVLGAGASRASGKEFTGNLSCLPPLNADFFTHLQRITAQKHRTTVAAVVKDLVDLFGSNFSLTLEDYFTQLEFLINAVEIATRTPELRRARLIKRRNNLMAALAAVLESSTSPIIKVGCSLHQHLVEHLSAGDSVVSFNYDCLVDDALRRSNGLWNPRWGYAFPPSYRLVGESWTPSNPANLRRESIRLYKLHGSVNWELPVAKNRPIRLKERFHRQRGVPRFSIIPPIWNKAITDTAEGLIYRYIWQHAARAIRRAEVICVVGFSFSSTDLYAQSLFRIAGEMNNRLRLLVIAIPDKETRRRIREVFDVPLADRNVVVRQYEDFTDLVAHLDVALTKVP